MIYASLGHDELIVLVWTEGETGRRADASDNNNPLAEDAGVKVLHQYLTLWLMQYCSLRIPWKQIYQLKKIMNIYPAI